MSRDDTIWCDCCGQDAERKESDRVVRAKVRRRDWRWPWTWLAPEQIDICEPCMDEIGKRVAERKEPQP